MQDTVSVAEFEKQVRSIDDVTIIIRAPETTRVKPYAFERASRNTSVRVWLTNRIHTCLGAVEFTLLHAGNAVNPSVNLNQIRGG